MNTIKCKFCDKDFNKKMRYCPFCGGGHKKEIVHQTPICPRCKCELTNQGYRRTTLAVCPECSGLWMDAREFKQLTSERDVYADDTVAYEFNRKPFPEEKEYLPCVRCDSLMWRKNFRKISGVLIDICHDHGMWLDAGELEQIRCFIANGGLDESQDKDFMMNKQEIESIAGRVKEVEFMQKVLHRWNIKHWIFSNH